MPTPAEGPPAPRHAWKFYRAGGFDQVRLDTGADLAALDQLDQKLWVTLSCPTRGLEFDRTTLDLIDADKDGRIRPNEIIASTKWACDMLKDPGVLLASAPHLALADFNDATPEGRQLLESARQILVNLGKKDAATISVEDTTDTERIFAQTQFNGDGIIPADSAPTPAVKSLIEDIIACLGAEPDRSGKPGINQANADQFFTEARAFCDWWDEALRNAGEILPLGEQTMSAAATRAAVSAKVDDYFARCRLAAFDPRASAALNPPDADYVAVAAKALSADASEAVGFPLATIEAGKPLPLKAAVNPAWMEAVATFRRDVVAPLLGDKDALAEEDWHAINRRFGAFDQWFARKAGAVVEKLGLDRARAVLAGDNRQVVNELIAKDKALEQAAGAIAAVDRLVRLNRDLYKLLMNFVSFRDFYSRLDKATFQAGTLYLDQRSCELCIRVEDVGRHASVAHMSSTCVLYCELVRRNTGERMTVAAALTAGDADNLIVGRNGIFYDRLGRDWDATIVRIIENPISVRQAFWLPYKRAIRLIQEQIAKRSSSAAAKDRLAQTAVDSGSDAIAGKAPAAVAPKMDIGVVAALGVAVGGITAALGFVLQAFFGLGIWMPMGLLGLILLISGPSMIIAWLKLRQRNLGPLLDANGWAINAKVKINTPFGASLTACAKLPPGSSRDLHDPYAEKKTGRRVAVIIAVVVVAVLALWYFGVFEHIVPDLLPKSGWMQRHGAAIDTKK